MSTKDLVANYIYELLYARKVWRISYKQFAKVFLPNFAIHLVITTCLELVITSMKLLQVVWYISLEMFQIY